MSNITKIIKLDFMLMKNYFKLILYLLAIALFITITSKSLTGGLIISMTFISVRIISLLFDIEEKSQISRWYGVLPISKRQQVAGRFLFFLALGGTCLLVSLLLQSAVLTVIGVKIQFSDYKIGIPISLAVYLFAIAIQLPGFYWLGAIKGRYLLFIPLIGFLFAFYLLGGLDAFGITTAQAVINAMSHPFKIIVPVFIVIFILLIVSYEISVKIYKEKER